MISPEDQAQLAVWRQKAADNTLTQDDCRAIITKLRAGRLSAAAASEASRRKKSQTVVKSGQELLAELMGGAK